MLMILPPSSMLPIHDREVSPLKSVLALPFHLEAVVAKDVIQLRQSIHFSS